ncbi:hypothetical protein GOP47_0012763 [Adiantum capillus-veneris]|uniref:Uncharacterized protein n=1 Tax=Adiantum capillus-veneris TaxID=13818 RepID=A0A9D4USE0_ADICA|nr:hypothetical protein GOP47_0012763 [Adiantum capillus-veneris]
MASLTIGSASMLQARPYAPSLVAPCRRSSAPARRANGCVSLCIRAAKLPSGVETPKEEPKLPTALWGFTQNAERWNSRAAMLGIIGIFLVELIIQKGILQVIGFEVGKGLNLPL